MKKKGFTLIELLAVIVILGIITVIAVPKVLDIINKSKESASNSSVKLVKDAIKTQIASSDLTGPVFTKETDGCYIFNFDDQTTENAKAFEIKNKEKVSGSIKYCNNTFSDDTLRFDNILSNNKQEDTKVNLLNDLLNDNYVTNNITITKYSNYISMYSSYGSDGIVFLKNEYNPKKYTRMIINGKRISGDSSYYHFFPGYTTNLSNWGTSLNIFYPSSGENFNYTIDLDLSDSITSIYPRIQYCVGIIEIYEWYLEK